MKSIPAWIDLVLSVTPSDLMPNEDAWWIVWANVGITAKRAAVNNSNLFILRALLFHLNIRAGGIPQDINQFPFPDIDFSGRESRKVIRSHLSLVI